MRPVAYAIDTHAAVKKFERAGLNAQQAEAVAEVINGAASEQVTKQDFALLRQEFAQQQQNFTQLRQDFNAFRAYCDEKFATKEELAKQGNKVVIAMFAGLGLLFTALQVFQ